MPATEKDIWDKFRAAATSISLIAVPVLVAWFGTSIERSNKEADVRLQTVEMAIGILQSPPEEETESSLRDWAIDVIDQYSGVQLPESAREELQRVALPRYLTPGSTTITTSERIRLSKGQTLPPSLLRSHSITLDAADENGVELTIRENDDDNEYQMMMSWDTTLRIENGPCRISPVAFVESESADFDLTCTTRGGAGTVIPTPTIELGIRG